MTETDMTAYYAKRAAEYEQIYQKPERQSDLRRLESTIADVFSNRSVLEIACGTGYWTQFACRSAESIVATDYNEEVIAIARKKKYGDCAISFIKEDAYTLENIDGQFSAGLAGFWWSHVPKANLGEFLRVFHSKLSKGARVVMLDNRYIEGSSTPISRTDDEENTYQIRQLSDGTTHEVLKNFPTREEFVRRIEPLSEECEFAELEYFWLCKYVVK